MLLSELHLMNSSFNSLAIKTGALHFLQNFHDALLDLFVEFLISRI